VSASAEVDAQHIRAIMAVRIDRNFIDTSWLIEQNKR